MFSMRPISSQNSCSASVHLCRALSLAARQVITADSRALSTVAFAQQRATRICGIASQVQFKPLSWNIISSRSAGAAMTAVMIDPELHMETTTIMFVDVVESVRLIEQNEQVNARRIRVTLQNLVDEVITSSGGRLIEFRGDGLLIFFADAQAAVGCSFELHVAITAKNQESGGINPILVRIGIHRSALFEDQQGAYGLGLSHAARIASEAVAGQTLVSSEVRGELTHGVNAQLRDLGNFHLKHVGAALRLFEVLPTEATMASHHSAELPKPAESVDIKLVVLPLDKLSISRDPMDQCGASEPNAVGNVFSDLVTQALSRSTGIKLISRLSAKSFSGSQPSAATLREKLAVDYAISGSWRYLNPEELLFAIELVDCTSGIVIWTDERRLLCTDLMQPQSEYIGSLTASIVSVITQAVIGKTATSPLPTIASHALVLSSIGLMHRLSRADFEASRRVIEAVVARVPRHAVPLAWLARWHTFRVVQGWASDDGADHEYAKRYAEKALALDPELSLVHAVAGSVHMSVRRELSTAFECYERAILLNPNDSLAWALKGAAHALNDDGNAALAATTTAIGLSPLDPMRFLHESLAASACLSLGDFLEARRWAEQSIIANRAHHSTLRVAAIACVLLGAIDAAKAYVNELRTALPSYTVHAFLQANPLAAISENRRVFANALQVAGLPRGQ